MAFNVHSFFANKRNRLLLPTHGLAVILLA